MKGFWLFDLPVKNADYGKLQKDQCFKVEFIGVWVITNTEYRVIFGTTEKNDRRVFDKRQGGV